MKLPSTLPMTVRFPLELYQAIQDIAEEQRRSFSWIVLRTLEEKILPQEKQESASVLTKKEEAV